MLQSKLTKTNSICGTVFSGVSKVACDCFSSLCSLLSDLLRQYICNLMLSQWDAKSKQDFNDRFVIITTSFSVIVVAAAVVILAFLILFPLFSNDGKHELSSFLFYTQLKIVHSGKELFMHSLTLFFSVMRLIIQSPSIDTVQKAEADKWSSRYQFLLWRPLKILQYSTMILRLLVNLPHLLCVQVSSCK